MSALLESDWETLRKCAVEGRAYRGLVEVSFGTIAALDFAELESTLALQVTGDIEGMSDIQLTPVDTKWIQGALIVIVEVSGDVSGVLANVEASRLV